VGNPDTVFLDVRSNEEWDGSNNRGNKHAGHVPGAIHLEWLNFVTRDAHRTLKSPHELRALLEEHGITPDKEVIPY
jgi:thiosulfate/3-mercaptopyruvate sulfurtransferase